MKKGAGRLLTVGDMARASGATARAVRLYESFGLIESCKRNSNGYRLFEEAQLDRLNLVLGLRRAGFGISSIVRLFSTARRSPTAADAARSLNSIFKERAAEMARTAKALSLLGSDMEKSAQLLVGCFDCDEAFDELQCGECEHFLAASRDGFPISLKALWPMKSPIQG